MKNNSFATHLTNLRMQPKKQRNLCRIAAYLAHLIMHTNPVEDIHSYGSKWCKMKAKPFSKLLKQHEIRFRKLTYNIYYAEKFCIHALVVSG